MKSKAVYPGTFDPITNGHLDIITRANQLFPSLIIAVANNTAKNPYFTIEERIELIQKAVKHLSGIEVIGFNGLLVNLAEQQEAQIILRGLRGVTDFEYEFQLAGMNRKLAPAIETVFLTPAENLLVISSTLIREIAKLGGDIASFVPTHVVKAFQAKQLPEN